MNKNIEQRGGVETMLEVIYPLLDKLAMMWIAGSVKDVHEKFVSHLIKRKCDVEIDKTESTRDETFLIYLPEGESNDLSLNFLHLIIKVKGFKVINIGKDVSIFDIAEVIHIKNPEYIFTIINDSMDDGQYKKYVELISNEVSTAKIILSGITPIRVELDNELAQKVQIVASSEETIEMLDSL